MTTAAGCCAPSVGGPTEFAGPSSVVRTLGSNFAREKSGEGGGGRRESGRMTMMACSNSNASRRVVAQVLTPHIRQLDNFFSKSLQVWLSCLLTIEIK